MNKTLFSIILLFLSNGMAFGQNIEIKIMSFNIQQPYGTNWDARKDSAARIITNENADVVGTQEAINSQRNYLLDNTLGYSYYGIGRDGDDNGEGCWIFYKHDKYTIDSTNSGNFWLSETPNLPSRFDGDYNRICTFVRLIDKSTQQGFYVFNAHFPVPELTNGRMQSMQLLSSYLFEKSKTGEPIIATGDFNSPESDTVTFWMKNSEKNPLTCRDSYRDIYPDKPVTTGFGTKLDYIYYPNQARYVTKNSWVVNKPSGASDHMPIVAEIEIMEN